MMKRPFLASMGMTAALAATAWILWHGDFPAVEPAALAENAKAQAGESASIASLKAEMERLKGIVPDQSHAMKDVAYHYANLWFAGQRENWLLADFYWSETRSHLRWAMRIIPIRKDPQGREVRVADMLAGIEAAALEPLHTAIKDKDRAKFVDAYQQMMASCYACHVASGKPFLRMQIPKQPAEAMIQFEPSP